MINMSKIAAIIASPRKNGSGSTIVNKMVDTLKDAGNDVQTFYMNQLEDIRGCQACMGCKKAGKCIRKDSTTPVLDAIRDADGVIISAADYFGQPCAQYRMLEDRFYGFINADFTPNIEAGKKVAVVVTCASGVEGAENIANGMEGVMTNYFKFESIGKIVYSELKDGPAKDNADVLAEAEDMAKRL